MSNRRKDQEAERVGDYLELERHLERLRQKQRPRRPRQMSPGLAKAYQMAALFQAAVAGAADPDPSFAVRLEAQLERERPGRRRWFQALLPARKHAGWGSRRALLTNGLAAVAGLVTGAVVGGAIDQQISRQALVAVLWWHVPLVSLGQEWMLVAQVAELAPGTMRQFCTETLVGYVFHNDPPADHRHRQSEPEWIALSAACPHMGCILAWNSQDRLLHCPCHAGSFTRFGTPVDASQRYLRALPRLAIQVVAGQVWVQVPAARHGTSRRTPEPR